MLAYWFEKAQYRILVGFHISAGKIGSVVAMWLLPPLVVLLGWRLGYGVISLFGPLALLICYLTLANRPADIGLTGMRTLAVTTTERSPRRPPPGLPLPVLLRNRNLLLVAASEFLIFSNYFGMTNWLPTYFKVTASLSDVEAGFQTGFILWGTIVGYALSGPAVNLVGRGAPIFAGGAAVSAILTAIFASGALMGLPTWSWPVIMLVYGLSVSIMVLTLPIITAFVPAASLATANGIVLALGYLGAMVSPPVIGAVADATGQLTLGFWVPVAGSACAFITAAFVREHEIIPERA
jgi:ACS family hexuronate transporter-like MFS transporter